MTRSLRLRLTVSIVAVLATMLLALSFVLHALFARALREQFDQRLLGDATAIAGMAEDDAMDGAFEYGPLPEFERDSRPAYFQAWLDDGHVLSRSPSLAGRDLAPAPGHTDQPVLTELVLPDSRRGRAIQLRQRLRFDEAPGAAASPPRVSNRSVTVMVARGTEELAATLAAVRRWLFGLALLALTAASAAVVLAVSRGLRSTRALANQIAGLDAAHLEGDLRADDLPEELTPLLTKTNELLSRLRASFAREKRFTADVSHELRTPLAALRTTFEVALSRDRSAPEYRAALEQAAVVAGHMENLCVNLLALARLDGPQPPAVDWQPVDLNAVVEECWRLHEGSARLRGLTFKNEIAPTAVVSTDPDRLRVIVSNLLSNAVTYTAEGGEIRVRQGSADAPDALLQVKDSGPPISAEAQPHLFERFFRGDPTRSDGLHCGIGLALVRGLSDALGFSVTAHNTADGGVTFAVRQTRGSS